MIRQKKIIAEKQFFVKFTVFHFFTSQILFCKCTAHMSYYMYTYQCSKEDIIYVILI
jgi:hypothetical protein